MFKVTIEDKALKKAVEGFSTKFPAVTDKTVHKTAVVGKTKEIIKRVKETTRQRTGHLKGSWFVRKIANAIYEIYNTASSGSEDAKNRYYANHLEYGTKAHTIKAKTLRKLKAFGREYEGAMLTFKIGNRFINKKEVNIPKMEGRFFVRNSILPMQKYMMELFQVEIRKLWAIK